MAIIAAARVNRFICNRSFVAANHRPSGVHCDCPACEFRVKRAGTCTMSGASMPPKPKRIAAIDIGTNSIHMIVAEAKSRGYRVVDREKEMVQLGLSSLDGQPLTDDAIERGVQSITRMAEIARRWEADEVIAVATSAVREAPNKRDFLRRVRDTANIKVRVISGDEEAD